MSTYRWVSSKSNMVGGNFLSYLFSKSPLADFFPQPPSNMNKYITIRDIYWQDSIDFAEETSWRRVEKYNPFLNNYEDSGNNTQKWALEKSAIQLFRGKEEKNWAESNEVQGSLVNTVSVFSPTSQGKFLCSNLVVMETIFSGEDVTG